MGHLLFPKLGSKVDRLSETQLRQIVEAMTGRAGDVSDRRSSALAYLGQFVAHDCLKSERGLTTRDVRPRLGLDSIYDLTHAGNGDLLHYHEIRDGGRLVGFDFCRNRDGTAIIAEERNDENRLVAQVHLLFQRLHNAVARELSTSGGAASGPVFQTIRSVCLLAYQRIVIFDFLRQLLDYPVWELYADQARQVLMSAWKPDELPLEFSAAAFRFGHSLVRNEYDIGRGRVRQLEHFFPRPPGPVAVDDAFLLSDFEKANEVMRVDALLARSMRLVPGAGQDHNVPYNNLLANRDLPTGKSIFSLLSERTEFRAFFEDYEEPRIHEAPFTGLDFLDHDNLPLWLYVLIESRQHNRGFRLGAIGSILIAEALCHAARATDPNCFMSDDALADCLGPDAYEVLMEIPTSLRDLINQLEDYESR